MKSDKEIINLVLNGNKRAFNEIINRYKNLFFHSVLSKIFDYQDAEEIVQDTFVKFFINLKDFRFECNTGTYLLKIARNLCIDYIRKYYRNKNLSKFYTKNRKEDIKVKNVLLKINKLTDNNRLLFELYFIEKYRYKEISKILDIPLGTVKSKINTLRKKLTQIFKELYNE